MAFPSIHETTTFGIQTRDLQGAGRCTPTTTSQKYHAERKWTYRYFFKLGWPQTAQLRRTLNPLLVLFSSRNNELNENILKKALVGNSREIWWKGNTGRVDKAINFLKKQNMPKHATLYEQTDCCNPGIVNWTFENRTQSSSIRGLSSIEFGNRTKSNTTLSVSSISEQIEFNRTNRTQSNSVRLIVFDWVRKPNSTEHN